MTLTELRYLVNLDKERHFGNAAERSFVSQPTLSVAIRKLEEQLGVVLFERVRGEVRPTPIGERLISQARHILAEVRVLEDMAREGQDELNGPLRFGAIYTVGPYLLPHLIPVLKKKAPAMPLVIEENFTARLMEQLRDNEIDVACVAVPVEQAQSMRTWALYDEEFMVLLPSEHRLAAKSALSARSLSDEKILLLGPGHCFRDQVIKACPSCIDTETDGARPHTGSSIETIRHMVAGGLGLTVLPRSAVENRPAGDRSLLCALPFDQKSPPSRRIALIWRKSFPRMRAISALREAILASPISGVMVLKSARQEDH